MRKKLRELTITRTDYTIKVKGLNIWGQRGMASLDEPQSDDLQCC